MRLKHSNGSLVNDITQRLSVCNEIEKRAIRSYIIRALIRTIKDFMVSS